MKKSIFVYMFCVSALSVCAQSEAKVAQDTTAAKTVQVFPEVKAQEQSLEEELAVAQKTIDVQNKQLLELRDIETKLGSAQRENIDLKKKLETAEKRTESVEKSLITLASNFLYVPYEAYGVEEVAVKAFESIQNPKLKQEYNQRYVLLKNYQNHLREFKAYLEKVQKACKGAFQATATEFINAVDPSVSSELILKRQPFYLEYVKYNEYKDTFIGGLILKTEAILKAHTKQNRANMQEIIEVIDKTQTPVLIDSVDKVIATIDERLKTVEDL